MDTFNRMSDIIDGPVQFIGWSAGCEMTCQVRESNYLITTYHRLHYILNPIKDRHTAGHE